MESTNAVKLLSALAQETRLAIFRMLVQQDAQGMAVGRIGEVLAIAPATLSFHIKELAHSELIVARQEGRFIYYSANFARMTELLAYLTENCCAGATCEISPHNAPNPCCPEETS